MAPAAMAWPCSKECEVKGENIAAGAGYFARVCFMKTEDTFINPGSEVTIEELVANRDKIFDLSSARPYVRPLDEAAKRVLGLLEE